MMTIDHHVDSNVRLWTGHNLDLSKSRWQKFSLQVNITKRWEKKIDITKEVEVDIISKKDESQGLKAQNKENLFELRK